MGPPVNLPYASREEAGKVINTMPSRQLGMAPACVLFIYDMYLNGIPLPVVFS